jgi:hypothetical protein
MFGFLKSRDEVIAELVVLLRAGWEFRPLENGGWRAARPGAATHTAWSLRQLMQDVGDDQEELLLLGEASARARLTP